MPSDYAIRVRKLSKCYPAQVQPLRQVFRLLAGRSAPAESCYAALQPIDFDVRRGETLAIIGRNGAGKSTLLQLMCGTLEPTTGTVEINGRLAALLELGAGFNTDFTGRENIYISAAVYGLTRQQVESKIDSIINFAQIGEHLEQPVRTYSSGMFVRLAFAIIAHIEADILVIDEALAVGDVFFTQKCMRFLKNFAKRGTLIFVSHDTLSVTNMCERVIWLEKGAVKQIGPSKTVVNQYLASFYTDETTASSAAPEDQARAGTHETLPAADNNFTDSFGLGGGKILRCQLLDESMQPLRTMERAQQLTLLVDCMGIENIERPIIGFFVKNRLGQPVCGANTLNLLDWPRLLAGEKRRISFRFTLPLLSSSDYTLTIALAAGTQEEHVQHHWIHDIYSFKTSAPLSAHGLFELDSIFCQNLEL